LLHSLDPAGKARAATEPRDLYRLTIQLRAVLETILLLDRLRLPCDRGDLDSALELARRPLPAMTSQGSAHGRFTRAVQQRNLWAAEMSLRELDQPSLEDALAYLDLLAEQKPEK